MRVGRRRYTAAAQLEAIPVPGWTVVSDEAAQRFRTMIAAEVAQLNVARSAPGAPNAAA
ncbi:Methylmalonyl-CoA mutase [Azospirillum endophyticum]